MSKKYAVILSGCGAKDGSEIHEAVSALMAIGFYAGEYQIFAPDMVQRHVINHITDEEMDESRNVLVEAARIARGNVLPLEKLDIDSYDALVFPGGFGAAKNLFSFAFDGLDFKVLPQIEKIVKGFHRAGKPIGAMCISPVMIARLLGDHKVKVTLGPDSELGHEVEKHFGAEVEPMEVTGAVVDKVNKVATTPCYMCDNATPILLLSGAKKMIEALEKM